MISYTDYDVIGCDIIYDNICDFTCEMRLLVDFRQSPREYNPYNRLFCSAAHSLAAASLQHFFVSSALESGPCLAHSLPADSLTGSFFDRYSTGLAPPGVPKAVLPFKLL